MLVTRVLARLHVGWFEDDGFLVHGAFLGWFLFAVRYPRCGGRPAWALANGVDHRLFAQSLFGAWVRPLCHDREEQPPPPPPLFSACRGM